MERAVAVQCDECFLTQTITLTTFAPPEVKLILMRMKDCDVFRVAFRCPHCDFNVFSCVWAKYPHIKAGVTIYPVWWAELQAYGCEEIVVVADFSTLNDAPPRIAHLPVTPLEIEDFDAQLAFVASPLMYLSES